MIDHLSPREEAEMASAAAGGAVWPRALGLFADGSRLRLGWDAAIAAPEAAGRLGIAPAAAAMALAEAARWCAAHGLHLMSFAGDGPGGEPTGEARWFMAVG